jgi:hypothetical protein
MKFSKILASAFALTLLFNISCRNDDSIVETPKGAYENGIFIANEGNIGTPNASVTFISNDFGTVEQDVYKKNNKTDLGDVFQALNYNGDNAYLVLNNSNKITVVNRYTFKKTGEITTEIKQPRYIAFASQNIYVTNDTYMGDKFLSIYKASDLSFVKKIVFTDTAERVVEAGGNIFVQHSSYGFGNKLTLINTTTNTPQPEIVLPNGNITKTISYNNSVYSIAAGSTDSYIYQISSTGNIAKTTILTGIADATNLEIDGGKFFFSSGNKVYSMDMNTTTVPTTPIIKASGGLYSVLYGFNVIDGKIFTADAKGFTEDSEITVYSTTGTILKTFKAGRATNCFYIN